MNKWIKNYILNSALYRNVQLRNESLETQNSKLIQENAELAERVNAVAEKLTKVTVQRSPDPINRIRVCVDVDTQLVHQGFMHGNDNLFIEYMGKSIGYRAATAIRSANYQRWER
jgi:hypothetical protein